MENSESGKVWECVKCGELVEADFAVCWRCGTGPDGAPTSDFRPETEVTVSEEIPAPRPVKIKPAFFYFGFLCFLLWGITLLITVFQNRLPAYVEYLISISGALAVCASMGLMAGILISLGGRGPDKPDKKSKKFVPDLVKDKKLCHNCLTPNFPREHFCVECATPLTSHAEIDPLGQVYALGDTYRKAAKRPVRPFIVMAMWLLLGSQIPYLLWALFTNVGEWSAPVASWGDYDMISGISPRQRFFATLGGVALILFLIGIYGAILYKVSKNYLRLHRRKVENDVEMIKSYK